MIAIVISAIASVIVLCMIFQSMNETMREKDE